MIINFLDDYTYGRLNAGLWFEENVLKERERENRRGSLISSYP